MGDMKAGFIGTGNMGSILVKAAAKALDCKDIAISDYSAAKARALSSATGVRIASNKEIAASCKAIYLGVKPQVLEKVLFEIGPVLEQRADDFTLISMAAGVPIERIRKFAGGVYPVIRIMPNLPAEVGEGLTVFAATDNVGEEAMQDFKELMSFTGTVDELPEKLIDVGCAVSGCGPAFVFMFIEAVADGAVECGLPRAKAIKYAAQTLLGASKLVLDSGKHTGELKDMVANPGGATIVGIHAMEKMGFRASVIDAITAAYGKTVKLGE